MSTLIQLIERAFLSGESEIAMFEVLRDVLIFHAIATHTICEEKCNVVMEENSMEEY